jgi:CubicO group peptidase (beta-lactamase class C family)
MDTDELILQRRAEGYVNGKDGLMLIRGPSMTLPWSAGAMYSTTGDLLKWEHGLFGRKVLSANSLKLMTTPGQADYGFGVFAMEEDGMNVILHGGGIEGFNSFLMYAPKRTIAVVVLSNVNGLAACAMPEQLFDVVLGKPVTLSTERKAIPISKDALAKFAGVYNVPPASSLTPPFVHTFPLKIAIAGDGLSIQEGDQQPFGMIYVGEKDGRPLFFVPTEYTEIEFAPDANRLIAALILHRWGFEVRATRQ